MLKNDIKTGISQAAELFKLDKKVEEDISNAITNNALSDPAGREVLEVSRDDETIVYYDLSKAITSAAGVLGGVIAAAPTPLNLAAALCAIGALGSLCGLQKKLPISSAKIVAALHANEGAEMDKETLLTNFEQAYEGPPEEMKFDFDRGLKALDQLDCIEIRHGKVHLSEFIILRN